jgi:hypothetical protein
LASFAVDDRAVTVSLDLDEAKMRALIAPHIVGVDVSDIDMARVDDLSKQFEATRQRHYDDPQGRARDQIRLQAELEPMTLRLTQRDDVATIVAAEVH